MIWLLGIVCIIVLVGVLSVDNKKQKDLFSFLVSVLMFLCFLLGVLMVDEVGIKSDKPLTPSVKIECKDGKCDTTYVYKEVTNEQF